MKSEMDKLMKNIQTGQPCPANCGGTIQKVDYSQIGQGAFLQCDKNGITHYKRISPQDQRTTVFFKLFRPENN